MRIEQICALNFAWMTFIVLSPYIKWFLPDGITNLLFFTSTLICTILLPNWYKTSLFVNKKKLMIGIVICLYILYFTSPLVHELRIGHLLWFTCFILILSYNNIVITLGYFYLKKIFFWVSVFALIFFVLNAIDFPLLYYKYVPDFRANIGDNYRIYGPTISLYRGESPIGNFGVERVTGVFGEPGHFGIYLGLILAVEKFHFIKRNNIVLLIAGILTFSTAFYGILGLGFLYRIITDKGLSKDLRVVVIAIFTIICVGVVFKGDIIKNAVYSRVFENSKAQGILGLIEQRSREDNKVNFDAFSKTDAIILGEGYFMDSREVQSTNWRGLIFRFGIVGSIMVIFLFIVIVRRVNFLYALLLFSIGILIASHRSFMLYTPGIFLLIYIATSVDKIKLINRRNIHHV